MTNKISLTELQALREKMTPGEWWVSDSDGGICAGPDGPEALDVGQVDWTQANVDGMLAEHGAMPVLLRVTRAAFELARLDNQCSGLPSNLRDLQRQRADAMMALHDALAEVLP